MAGVLTEKQLPYTGPYSLSSGPHKSKGPTVEAMKRALSRAGAPSLPWTDFNQTYNEALEKAWDWYDPGGQNGYGEGRWKLLRRMKADPKGSHPGEFACDLYGRTLIQDEAGATSTSDLLTDFHKFFTEFCRKAIANEAAWHYDQGRPVRLNINPSASYVESDCSGFGIQAADYARRKMGLPQAIADPAKQNWTGYGNTDWYEDDWPKVASPFRVGDAAHFYSERHVIWCIKPGTVTTAEWASNGSEGGPDLVKLSTYSRYPGEYLFTVRPDYVL